MQALSSLQGVTRQPDQATREFIFQQTMYRIKVSNTQLSTAQDLHLGRLNSRSWLGQP